MTTQRLNQYPYLPAKINRLQKEVEKARQEQIVCGAVLSSDGPGCKQREVLVMGCDEEGLQKKEAELAAAEAELAVINAFIQGVEDIRIKEILTLRYIYGEPWKEVAEHFGYNETEDTVQKATERFLKRVSSMSSMS